MLLPAAAKFLQFSVYFWDFLNFTQTDGVLLPAARFLQCLPHSHHSWASTKLAAESLMDLTDCGFDGFFNAEF